MNELLIENALKQFMEHGIRNMTMQKLASAMSISTKTMYKHFDDKEKLLEECLKVHYARMNGEFKALLNDAPNPVVFLCRMYTKATELDFGVNHVFYHDLNYYYPELQDKVITLLTGHFTGGLTVIIKQGIAEGYFLPTLQPAVVMEALTVLYTSVTRHDTYKKFGLTPSEAARHTVGVYLRGICTEQGLKIINQIKTNN